VPQEPARGLAYEQEANANGEREIWLAAEIRAASSEDAKARLISPTPDPPTPPEGRQPGQS
jgi:hypothetical protein